MSETKHTPLPWRVDLLTEDHPGMAPRLYGACADKLIAEVGNAEPWTKAKLEWEANAAFIVRACNVHDDLVKVLEAATHALRSYQMGNASPQLAKSIAEACDAALAKAEAL